MIFDVKKLGIIGKCAEYFDSFDDFETGWNQCSRGDWMLGIAIELKLDKRLLTLVSALCANTVRHLIPNDNIISLIDAGISFGKGIIPEYELSESFSRASHSAGFINVSLLSLKISGHEIQEYALQAAAATASATSIGKLICFGNIERRNSARWAALSLKGNDSDNNFKLTAKICKEHLTPVVLEAVKKFK